MQCMDPFPVRCEFCQHLAYYPLTPLKAEKAACTACKKVLRQSARELRISSRKHGIQVWPSAFIFEAMMKFDVDLDLVCEDELNQDTTLSAFIKLFQQAKLSISAHDILNFDMLDTARSTCDDEQLLALTLRELALISHPEEPLPDANSLADPNVKGIETYELKAKHEKRRIARQAQDTLTGRKFYESPLVEMNDPVTNKRAAFWENVPSEEKNKPLTEEDIQDTIRSLGYKLPTLYLQLMTIQNGGYPQNTLIQLDNEKPTNYSISEFIELDSIEAESEYMRNEWGYPDIGLYICDCPSAGHHLVALDYTDCGPEGEPTVVHVDQENDFKKTILAANFEQFVDKLHYDPD